MGFFLSMKSDNKTIIEWHALSSKFLKAVFIYKGRPRSNLVRYEGTLLEL